MTKPHALGVTSILGVAAIAGVLALGSTVSLGQASKGDPDASVQERQAALDRAEGQIAKLDASVPPRLPAAPAVQSPATPQVVVVRTTSEAADDDEWEGEHEQERDEGHAWDDDHEDDEGWDD